MKQPETVLYDGSKDLLYPNKIIVTNKYWSRKSKHAANVVRVDNYNKVVVVYCIEDSRSDSQTIKQEVRKILKLRVIPKEAGLKQFNYMCKNTPEGLRMPQCFMYDGFLFVVRLLGRSLVWRQYDTKTKTQTIVPKYSKKEFADSGLTLFIRTWHKLPFGSKRVFDPALLEYSKVIDISTVPIPIRKYHTNFCDLNIVSYE